VPRFLQLVALSLALLLVGAPAIAAEMIEDDCAEECAGEESERSCPEEGCTDCSVLCPGCARPHVVATTAVARPTSWATSYVEISSDDTERVPLGPPPDGVFHPPRPAPRSAV
jgi:hypothetical protein